MTVANSLLHRGEVLQCRASTLTTDATRLWPQVPHHRTGQAARRLSHRVGGASRVPDLFWHEHIPRPEPQVDVYDEPDACVRRASDFAWAKYGCFAEIGRQARSTCTSADATGATLDARSCCGEKQSRGGRCCAVDRLGLHPDHVGGPRAGHCLARPHRDLLTPGRRGRPERRPSASCLPPGGVAPTLRTSGIPARAGIREPVSPYDDRAVLVGGGEHDRGAGRDVGGGADPGEQVLEGAAGWRPGP